MSQLSQALDPSALPENVSEGFHFIRDTLSNTFGAQSQLDPKDRVPPVFELPKPKTLLEVYTSTQTRYAVFWITFMSIFGFILTICFVIVDSLVFATTISYKTSPDLWDYFKTIYRPGFHAYIQIIVWAALMITLFAMLVIFSIHIYRRTTTLMIEQLQVYPLVMFTVLYTCPYITLAESIHGLSAAEAMQSIVFEGMSFYSIPLFRVATISSFLAYVGFIFCILVYVLSATKVYRKLDDEISFRSFFARKSFLIKILILFVVYSVFRILGTLGPRIIFSGTLFGTFFSALKITIYSPLDLEERWCFVVALQIIDVIVIGWVIHSFKVTKRFLKMHSYVRYRNKQLGFRLFLYETILMLVFQFLSEIVQIFVSPAKQYVVLYQQTGILLLYMTAGDTAGRSVGLFAYVLLRMYSNLPADVAGVFKFERRNETEQELENRLAPFKINYLDSQDDCGNLKLVNRNFTLETQVLMLNFSFLSYRLFVEGEENRSPQYYKDYEHTIVRKIKEDKFDTHAIIVESDDRIIVGFRGTVSKKNVESDMNVKRIKLRTVFGELAGDNYGKRHEWKHARVHKGFSDSYASVRQEIEEVVIELFNQRNRIVFVCGHSLGGALATLFSFGLSLRYPNIRQKGISLTTFGSPRVGDLLFASIFEEYVPIYWRIVNSGDMVTKIPGRPYKHVGVRVLLTTTCEMFVDPALIDNFAWHKTEQCMATHRLPSYYMSLRHYVEHYHGKNIANLVGFWDWSLDDKIRRMYQHNLSRRNSMAQGGQTAKTMTRGVQCWRDLVWAIIMRSNHQLEMEEKA